MAAINESTEIQCKRATEKILDSGVKKRLEDLHFKMIFEIHLLRHERDKNLLKVKSLKSEIVKLTSGLKK